MLQPFFKKFCFFILKSNTALSSFGVSHFTFVSFSFQQKERLLQGDFLFVLFDEILVKYSQYLSSNVNKHCRLHSLAASLKEKLIQTFAQKQNNLLFWPKFNVCLLCLRCFDIFIEIKVTIIYFLILL